MKGWDAEDDHPTEGVKELGKSKWSDDLDEDDTEGSDGVKGNLNALSGLIQAYKNRGKSVYWSDQVTLLCLVLLFCYVECLCETGRWRAGGITALFMYCLPQTGCPCMEVLP